MLSGNNNFGRLRSEVTTYTNPNYKFLHAVWLGYQHQRAGMPFSLDYDSWELAVQANYERGRLMALDPQCSSEQWPEEFKTPKCIVKATRDRVNEPPKHMLRLEYEPETLGALRPIPGRGRGRAWRPLDPPAKCTPPRVTSIEALGL